MGDKTQLLSLVLTARVRRRRTPRSSHFGVFGTAAIAFFLAEMGDKTQIATVMLAATLRGRLRVGRHGHDDRDAAGQHRRWAYTSARADLLQLAGA